MAEAIPPTALQTTQDERTMATLAHALQIIGSWIAPLVIFLIRRESRFVSFHALQALLLQIVHVIVIVIFMVGWFTLIFSTIFHTVGSKPPAAPPPAVFAVFPLLWLFIMGANITILVIAIVYAIKAGRGEWADYPVLGRLARKMLKMGPPGANLT
ncbi:MAG TPA: DUF4870 domain-containing protein [Candidatus Angelobacter sp.]|nr:DUF4870 domain-containing protein [Candidatus Angelobacter sp.]